MIRPALDEDFNFIYEIINDAATAYKGIIPDDRWHEPYMSKEELQTQIREGVQFFCYTQEPDILGVMGIQDRGEVNLIRHAYVRTSKRNSGIGGSLLKYLLSKSQKPVLVGTWKDAFWAVGFYEKNGFCSVSENEKNRLLRTFWNIPERQVETSVVLLKNL